MTELLFLKVTSVLKSMRNGSRQFLNAMSMGNQKMVFNKTSLTTAIIGPKIIGTLFMKAI